MQKSVLITGASSGFGLVACEAFLAQNWRVLAAVRGGKEREALFTDLLARFPSRMEIVELDLLDNASIDRLYHTAQAHAPLDALINNAGYGLFGSIEDTSDESLRKQMEVNFFGTVKLTQKLLPLLRHSQGVVLTVSSILGRHAFPLTGGYCASKFAVEGFMESLSAEVKPFGIKAYILEPGAFPTGFGSSLDWTLPLPSSPYLKATVGYQRLRLKISEKNKGKSLTPVGKKMVHLVTNRPFGLRHAVGSDAVATVWIARLVPANLFHQVLSAVINKLQRRQA